MKQKTYLFIAISSVALLIVLSIQVNWILQTAKIKEQLFNEKASMVLSRTTETIGNDKETYRKIESCVRESDASVASVQLGDSEAHKIDSLLVHYMKFYNFHVDYSFEVTKPLPSKAVLVKYNDKDANNPNTGEQACHQISLDQMVHENGWELKLILPAKEKFILAEMRMPFLASVVLILVVLVLFWRTVLSLTREKKISEHTTDFLNNMTHEFKTPLTSIALAGKMIVKDPTANPDKLKYYSGIILEENEKLRLQVEQVLSMTALERGEIPLQKTELNFHDLIHEAVKSIGIQVENRQGDLKLNLDAEELVVMGDKTHLVNVLLNLIDNAIKYSKEKPEIAVWTFNAGRNLIVVVSDHGIGIEKEYQKNVFDKYFRVPTGDVHDVKGFGLGLAYIKKIVEMHGGTIELESEKGKGTTFNITLPNV